jgi:hypothetical protein
MFRHPVKCHLSLVESVAGMVDLVSQHHDVYNRFGVGLSSSQCRCSLSLLVNEANCGSDTELIWLGLGLAA